MVRRCWYVSGSRSRMYGGLFFSATLGFWHSRTTWDTDNKGETGRHSRAPFRSLGEEVKFFLSTWGLVTSSVVELRPLAGDMTEAAWAHWGVFTEGGFANAWDHPDTASQVTLPPQPNSANI